MMNIAADPHEALIALTKDIVTFSLKPRFGAGRYILTGLIHSESNRPANAGLITVAFVDRTGGRIANPLGWSVSKTLGVPFRYIGALKRGLNRYELDLALDGTVAEVVVGVRTWMSGPGLSIVPMELRRHGVKAALLPEPDPGTANDRPAVTPAAVAAVPLVTPPRPEPVPAPPPAVAVLAPAAPVPAAAPSVPAPAVPSDDGVLVRLRVNEGAHSASHAYLIEEGYTYGLRAEVEAAPPGEKLFLLRFEFEGPALAAGARPHGLSYSERHGLFAYLAAGENRLRLVAPQGAVRMRVQVIPWAMRSGEVSIDAQPTTLKVADAVFARSVDAAVARIVRLAAAAPNFVLIYTGTKRIGEGGRANRSMMFARELERLGVPTIYTYVPSEGDGLPDEEESCLLQLPIAYLDRVATRLAAEIRSPQRILIGSLPDERYCRFAGLFRHSGWRVIYECRDDWAEFASVGAAKWYADVFERFAVAQAEKVFCVSPALMRSMRRFTDDAEKVLLSANGTTDHFIQSGAAIRRRRRWPAAVRERETQPIVGYFGHLTEQWFDWGAVAAAAYRLPQVRFEIIGFDMPKLPLPDNVAYLGSMTHAQILDVAPRWSVALIPFRHSKLSRAADPIKIYEYLALGLKVVACPMGTIDTYPLTFCYEEFGLLDALQQALAYRPTAGDWRRIGRLLAGASWRSRLIDMLARSGVRIDDAPAPLGAQ